MQICKAKNASHIRTASTAAAEYSKAKQKTNVYTKYLTLPENRIKEQLTLFSDRTSTAYLRSNQLRLYFSSMAYVLMQMFRRLGLQGTELATAQCATIRLKLFKIGALIRITVRKVWILLSSACPYAGLFRQIHARLAALPLRC